MHGANTSMNKMNQKIITKVYKEEEEEGNIIQIK